MDSLDRFPVHREARERLKNIFLPEELIENIITMMPFPEILKARTLSRAWLAKFSPVESADERKNYRNPFEADEAAKIRFQKMVSERSNKWDKFLAWIITDEFWAYDQQFHIWERLLSLSFLPEIFPTFREAPERLLTYSNVQMAGALLFLYPGDGIRSNVVEDYDFCVANILTRSWKRLPNWPHREIDTILSANMVSDTSFQTHKVILLSSYLDEVDDEEVGDDVITPNTCLAQIFDSESQSWSDKIFHFEATGLRLDTRGAYLNGVLYIIDRDLNLMALNVEDGDVEYLDTPDEIDGADTVHLLVCEGNLVMVVKKTPRCEQPFLTYHVLKLDPQSETMSEVARGPPPLNLGTWNTQPVNHGHSVLFGAEESIFGRMLSYNLHRDEWSCFPVPGGVSQSFNCSWKYKRTDIGKCDWETQRRNWYENNLDDCTAVSFQPGLNLFAAL